MSRSSAFRILGRISLLPTVWSNCLAGWWLGGHEYTANLPWLFIGPTLLYLGGECLHQAIELELNQPQTQNRPSVFATGLLGALWRWALALLALGAVCLIGIGKITGALGVVLLVCIIASGAVHRGSPFAPLLAGLSRFFIYLVAASAAADGVTGWAIWCGLALAAYVTGVGLLPGHKASRGFAQYWPLLPAAAPVALTLIMNAHDYREPALLLSVILVLWTIRSLRPGLWSPEHDMPRTESALMAGIVLVDLLAVADAPRPIDALFLLLFATALMFRSAGSPGHQRSHSQADSAT